jgi:type I restriction enzyme S subunit
VLPMFDKVIETFKTSSTEQCEIVATLYSAWEDLQHRSQPFTDDDILNEVLNHWHDSKKRISSSRWQKALDWMRKNGFVPTLGNNN